jgi:hypothetical protein
MKTKLTLKMDSSIIQNAKIYARSKNVSLSHLIENYLSLLTNSKGDEEVTPLVKSLSGVIKLPRQFDYKAEYKKHLKDKCLKYNEF